MTFLYSPCGSNSFVVSVETSDLCSMSFPNSSSGCSCQHGFTVFRLEEDAYCDSILSDGMFFPLHTKLTGSKGSSDSDV